MSASVRTPSGCHTLRCQVLTMASSLPPSAGFSQAAPCARVSRVEGTLSCDVFRIQFLYAIRLPGKKVLYEAVKHLLKCPARRPSRKPKVFYHSFQYQAASWRKPRRVVAKVEWHLGELFPRVGLVVTNLSWSSDNIVGFYNKRGTAEQWIKEGKNAVKWTRLSCREFKDNAVRLHLFALAHNLANFLRRLALPGSIRHWSLTTLEEKLVKIGAKVVRHSRYVIFQLAEVAVPRDLFAAILGRIQRLALAAT